MVLGLRQGINTSEDRLPVDHRLELTVKMDYRLVVSAVNGRVQQDEQERSKTVRHSVSMSCHGKIQ